MTTSSRRPVEPNGHSTPAEGSPRIIARCEDFGNAYYLDLHDGHGEVYEVAFTPDEWGEFLDQARLWRRTRLGRRWWPWR